jgi:hypothetical protein
LTQEYISTVQRRDFYKWIISELKDKGDKITWFKMAYFITSKLHLMEIFPFNIFINNTILGYAHQCCASIFKHVFVETKKLYKSDVILNEKEALEWDMEILYKEQYLWVNDVIKAIDYHTLKKIEHILQGKFLYGLLVPKAIRFHESLSNKEIRYKYAVHILRPYCKNKFK